MPAEVSRQARVMLASSVYPSFRKCWPVHETKLTMVRELLQSESVLFLVNSVQEGEQFATDLRARGCTSEQLKRFDARVVEHSDHWVRDYGGTFVRDAEGKQRVLQFKFDGYNYNSFLSAEERAPFVHDALVAERVAAALELPCQNVPLVCEGGNIHVNGSDAVIATTVGLLNQNPSLTRSEVEAILNGALGTSRVIWLPSVLASDAHAVLVSPFTIGGELVTGMGVNHSDEMVAWVNVHTVLLPEVTEGEVAAATAVGDPTAAISRAALEEAHAVLRANQLDVVRVPEPGSIIVELTPEDTMYQLLRAFAEQSPQWRGASMFEGGRPIKHLLAASYMNFVVANHVCLVPKFFKPGRDEALRAKDETFRETIERLYAPRRVVQIDVDALAAGGGGMHCITQQIPE